MSDSSEPDKKRKRLSNYVVKPSSIPPEKTNLRRSKRVKFKPLAFWANERIEHHREILTYDKLEDAFENGKASEIIHFPELQKNKNGKTKKRSTSKRTSKKSSKSKKSKGKKQRIKSEIEDILSQDDYYMYDDDDDDDDDKQYDGNAWVYDSNTDKMIQKCVVKTKNCVKLVPLNYNNNNNNNDDDNDNSISKAVRGAKGLEEKGFSCGILEIPPSSEKCPEISYFTEQFFVHQCEKKKLLFKLGEDSFHLSRGTMFFVPPENEYSLHNLSKTHPVQLIFTLIKNEELTTTTTTTNSNNHENIDDDDVDN